MANIILKGGSLVWDGNPGRGGHIMYVLQWLEGLKRQGHEVLYYDDYNPQLVTNQENAIRLFSEVMSNWWKPELSAFVDESGNAMSGLSGKEVKKFGKQAAAIITLGCTFSVEPKEWLRDIHPRIFIEQDPGFSHIWAGKSSPEDVFGKHDIHFTVGPHVGTARCSVPTFEINWLPIWNPVILDWWNPEATIFRNRFTTVAGWWGNSYHEFEGKMWGPKAEQIKKFIRLPKLSGEKIEIALETSPDDPEIEYLKVNGWFVESPEVATANVEAYKHYIESSVGEFSCAKGLYVGTKSGWFSDRSSCFLAAGRPVVVQDTGFTDLLPTGRGLFAVSDVEEAAEAIKQIRCDYKLHSKAARDIAVEYFDSGKVLSKINQLL